MLSTRLLHRGFAIRAVLFLSFLTLSKTASATTDDELSDGAQMKLAAVERELGKFDPSTRPWADGENPETAEREMYNTEVVLSRMRGWLDAVPQDQRDAPRVVAATERVASTTWRCRAVPTVSLRSHR